MDSASSSEEQITKLEQQILKERRSLAKASVNEERHEKGLHIFRRIEILEELLKELKEQQKA